MNLSVEHICVSISKKEIVKNISLNVQNGEVVGILGPNGCGKSTLLKSIYKVLKPSEGTVFLEKENVIDAKPKSIAKKMAVVGQFNELSFDFSVQEVVMLGRAPHKSLMEADKEEDFQLVENALRIVNLLEYKDRSYSTLSGGEKQRVILARAIAQEPKFLVLDEPTNHLDIKYQLQILNIVKKLNIGVLAALHDLTISADFCDKIYMMKKGEIIAYGSPTEILTKELIKEVYEIDCEIYRNPINNKFAIVYC
ncbi:MAG: ABC transporter ATP-binding protein [Aminipila sp.]